MYMYNNMGNHKPICSAKILYGDLVNASESSTKEVEVFTSNDDISFNIANILIHTNHSFMDFIFGGCELGLQIAVDMTSSNGPITNPNSLHNLDLTKN